ncbi:MAG: SUMF1/EgtB/PvdO family nonheme iron enzyme [Chitinophagales bacterium]
MTTTTIPIVTKTFHANGIPIEMVHIEAGSYEMGYGEEKSPITITFKEDYHIAQYPVTNELWKAVMGEANEHSAFTGSKHPVERVSWDDICEKGGFLDTLNALPAIAERNAATGKRFRLPTESQWEYAARGGKYWEQYPYQYAGSNHLKEVAWYDKNSHGSTQPVGLKMPNVLGLYDMSGNVFEWCEDIYNNDRSKIPTDGTACQDGDANRRLVRGGSWLNLGDGCRVAYRFGSYHDIRDNYLGCRLSWY